MIHECENCTDLHFASPYFLLRKMVTYKRVGKCVQHLYAKSWAYSKDSSGGLQSNLLIMKVITGVCLIAVIFLVVVVFRIRKDRIQIQMQEGIGDSEENLSE